MTYKINSIVLTYVLILFAFCKVMIIMTNHKVRIHDVTFLFFLKNNIFLARMYKLVEISLPFMVILIVYFQYCKKRDREKKAQNLLLRLSQLLLRFSPRHRPISTRNRMIFGTMSLFDHITHIT